MEPSSRTSVVPSPSTWSPSSDPVQRKPIESRAYSTSRPASKAPKAISPPWAMIVSVAGPQILSKRDPRCRPRRSASGRSGGNWPAPSRRGLHELRHRTKIVGGGREVKGPSDTLAAAELGSLLAGDRFDPAEGLLDPLANPLAAGDERGRLIRSNGSSRRALRPAHPLRRWRVVMV
jgi:hypothetical protein